MVLALLQATGIAEVVRRATCEEECKSDGCGDECTPGSDACHCPAAPTATAPANIVETLAPPAVAVVIRFERSERVHASPDPREILHVPRPYAV